MIMKWVHKFCIKHPRFGIPNLILYLLAGNVAVFLISIMDTTGTFQSFLHFDAALILKGQVWRLLSFVLIPDQMNTMYFAISVVFYYFIGNSLEKIWGPARFTIYYFSGIIITVLYGLICYLTMGVRLYLSSTYINLSMLFCFATLEPDTYVTLYFIIPIKFKWFAFVNALYFLIQIVSNVFPYNLLPVVAILNYLVFCGEDLMHLIRPLFNRSTNNGANFKNKIRHINREQRKQSYTHKCSVCGKTDGDHPELSFRYCSRCTGYHCFCQEHINNHIHFKD